MMAPQTPERGQACLDPSGRDGGGERMTFVIAERGKRVAGAEGES
jgi:hypothetical protein